MCIRDSDATGYSPNFLVLGREVRAPVDLVFGNEDEEPPDEDYPSFVEKIRAHSVSAFAEVRRSLGRVAERNKRYYNIGLQPKKYDIGDWVLYSNQRKYRGKQNKWISTYEGPYLVIEIPSSSSFLGLLRYFPLRELT